MRSRRRSPPQPQETPVDDKLIVSHRAALKAKYGAAGLAQIQEAVRALIAADRQRGIRSRLVFLDDAAQLKKMGGTPATLPAIFEARNAIPAAIAEAQKVEGYVVRKMGESELLHAKLWKDIKEGNPPAAYIRPGLPSTALNVLLYPFRLLFTNGIFAADG
jgi:hypothetical protein